MFFKQNGTGATALLAAMFVMFFSCPASEALTLDFDYSYDTSGFFDNNQAKYTLEAAGNFFESVLQDDLAAISSGKRGSFTANFYDPSTGKDIVSEGFSVAKNTLKIYVGARDLKGFTLGSGGPGGYSISNYTPNSDWYLSVITRGEGATTDVRGDSATDFAPWGGSLAFDSNASWFFDQTPATADDIPSGWSDFYSVALHEIAHLLGFGIADSWKNLVSDQDFTGTNARKVYGQDPPLSLYKVHWKNGIVSRVPGINMLQEAAMDPSIKVGTRKYVTELDLAALDDIGWDVNYEMAASFYTVPAPSALLLLGCGLALITGIRRKKG